MLTAQEYQTLVNEYEKDTVFLSYHVFKHPAYQKLLSEGESIIPFLLRDLVRNDAGWLQLNLLHHIVKPIMPEDMEGDFVLQREMFLDWAGRTKYANYLVLI